MTTDSLAHIKIRALVAQGKTKEDATNQVIAELEARVREQSDMLGECMEYMPEEGLRAVFQQ